MNNIVARTYSGGIDLYHGLPDLLDAKVVDVQYNHSDGDYQTTLVLEDSKGKLHQIMIVQ